MKLKSMLTIFRYDETKINIYARYNIAFLHYAVKVKFEKNVNAKPCVLSEDDHIHKNSNPYSIYYFIRTLSNS